MQYEHDQAGKEEVSQEMVEEALWQKLQLARDIDADLQGPYNVIVLTSLAGIHLYVSISMGVL